MTYWVNIFTGLLFYAYFFYFIGKHQVGIQDFDITEGVQCFLNASTYQDPQFVQIDSVF